MDVSPTINSFHGRIRSITGTDPAAGEEISETVPDRRRWRILSIKFTLTTDDNVADRSVVLKYSINATDYYNLPTPSSQAASLARTYSYGLNGPHQDIILDSFSLSLPSIILPPLATIRTSTNLIQIGDNYSSPKFLVEEWIDP